jgi:hypothetical protein
MAPRLGMALVGLGAATPPHLRSLQDLSERIDLRYAVTRHPHPDRIRPYTGPVRWVSDLDEALNDPQVQAVIVATPPTWTSVGVASLPVNMSCSKNRWNWTWKGQSTWHLWPGKAVGTGVWSCSTGFVKHRWFCRMWSTKGAWVKSRPHRCACHGGDRKPITTNWAEAPWHVMVAGCY